MKTRCPGVPPTTNTELVSNAETPWTPLQNADFEKDRLMMVMHRRREEAEKQGSWKMEWTGLLGWREGVLRKRVGRCASDGEREVRGVGGFWGVSFFTAHL